METKSELASDDHSPKDHLQPENPQLPGVPEIQSQANGVESADRILEPESIPSDIISNTPDSPDLPAAFDWDDFEKRYEAALERADAREKEILKEAEDLARVSWFLVSGSQI
jgi:hypothetical protein